METPACEPKKTPAITLLAVSGAPLISMRGQDTLCGNSVWNLILIHDKYTFDVCCYNLYKDKKDERILSFILLYLGLGLCYNELKRTYIFDSS